MALVLIASIYSDSRNYSNVFQNSCYKLEIILRQKNIEQEWKIKSAIHI